MADAVEQPLSDDQSMDSEFRIAADLARERAKARRQSVEITERIRDFEVANDNGSGGRVERLRPAAYAPSGGSFEDDMRSRSPANDNALPGEASPAFVRPETPGAAPDANPDANNLNDLERDEGLKNTIPQKKSSPSPDLGRDASVGNQPAGSVPGSADYGDQFSKTPDTSDVPLVSENGGPVGMPAAYAGENYQGLDSGTLPGGSASPDGTPEIDEPAMDAGTSQPVGGLRGAVNNRMGGIMSLVNRPEIRRLQKQIEDRMKEIDALDKRIQEYKKKNIRPLKRALRSAIFVDTARKIRNYLAVMVEFWWWTIIGAIIDLCLTIPIIIVLYGSGALKGKTAKEISAQIKKQESIVKRMEKAKLQIERQVQQLRQQQFELTQVFTAESERQRNEQRPGQPPTAGGIPLAT